MLSSGEGGMCCPVQYANCCPDMNPGCINGTAGMSEGNGPFSDGLWHHENSFCPVGASNIDGATRSTCITSAP